MSTDKKDIAEKTIKALSENYVQWTREQVSVLYEKLSLFTAGSDQEKQDIQKIIYDISHNIKGMGGSFNYPLMTDVGASLCLYLKKLPSNMQAHEKIIEAHIKSFDTIIHQEISGDGGDAGANLLTRLQSLVQKGLDQ